LEPYQSAVVPAALDVLMVRAAAAGDGAGLGSMLVAAPPRDASALERRFGRAGVSLANATDFLSQF
jgi:hypothetical protein